MSDSGYTHAGGVVYRLSGSTPEYLLVPAKAAAREWVFPKGHIDPGETPEQAAVREVAEEAGVAAEIVSALGDITLPRGLSRMFLMRYVGPANNVAEREAVWLSYEEAVRRSTFEESRALLEKGHNEIERRA